MAKKKSLKKYQAHNSQVTDSTNADILRYLRLMELNNRPPVHPIIPSKSSSTPDTSSFPPALEHMMKTRPSKGARKGGSIKKKK